MLKKLRDRLEGNEEGFTLIELLVVVIIIGILAAIAIPTFLNQRENAWRSSVESDLRNLATNMETCYARDGAYPAAGEVADAEELCDGVSARVSDGSEISITTGGGQVFALSGTHTQLDETVTYDSQTGGLGEWGAGGGGGDD